MAINIKELFNADADNIRVDKINYNFDQILANGGGPIGVKGNQGTTGNTGTKGQKGDLGGDGDKGEKGNDGSSANLWDSDTIVSTTGTDINILRPYNNDTSQSGEEDLRTRLILGQATSGQNDTTPTEPTSLLTLILPPEDNDDTTSQIIFVNDETTGDPKEFKMATSYEVGTGSTFTLSALAPVSGEETNLNILMPNKVEVNAIDVEIDASNNIEINGVNRVDIISAQLVTIGDLNDTVQVDIKAEQFVDIDSGEYIYMDAQDSIELTANSILLNAQTNTLTATTANELDAPLNELTATTKNSLSAPLNELSAENNNIINTTLTSGLNNLRNNGVDKFTTSDSINTSTQNIFFSEPGGDHDGDTAKAVDSSEVSRGDGVEWKEGGAATPGNTTGNIYYAAPNNGSNVYQRTLSDYFYSEEITKSTGAFKFYENTPIPSTSTDGMITDTYIQNPDLVSHSSPNTSTVTYTYTKVGNLINCWGNAELKMITSEFSTGFSTTEIIAIDLNNNYDFPYLNTMTGPIDVSVRISTAQSQNVSTGDEWYNSIDNWNTYTMVGRIYGGDNKIYLWRQGFHNTSNTMTTGPIQVRLDWKPINYQFLLGDNTVSDMTLYVSFNFSMPVEWNSYNRVLNTSGSSSEETEEFSTGETESGSESTGTTGGPTEIQLFNNVPNSSNPLEQPLTNWQSTQHSYQSNTYTTTFYSNMGDGAGLTITNPPPFAINNNWISNISFTKTGGPFTVTNNTNGFLNPSTSYSEWTLSVTLTQRNSENDRDFDCPVVPVDDTNWSLPSGITTFKIRQGGN